MGRTSTARERLICAAITLIGKRSYHEVGVQEICEQAAVQKGSFYHFFASKQALTIEAIETMWSINDRTLKAALADTTVPVEERLLKLFADASQGQAKEGCTGCPFGNLALELANTDEEVRAKLVDVFGRWEARIIEQISQLPAFATATEEKKRETARGFIALLEGSILLAKTANDPTRICSMRGVVTRLLAG